MYIGTRMSKTRSRAKSMLGPQCILLTHGTGDTRCFDTRVAFTALQMTHSLSATPASMNASTGKKKATTAIFT